MRLKQSAAATPDATAEAPPAGAWYVYLIECSDGSVYTGIAVDVARRYALHAGGKGARYTRSRPPRRLLASFPCAGRSSALKAECAIKRLTPAQKRALPRRLPEALVALMRGEG